MWVSAWTAKVFKQELWEYHCMWNNKLGWLQEHVVWHGGILTLVDRVKCCGLPLQEVDTYHMSKFDKEGYLDGQVLAHFRG